MKEDAEGPQRNEGSHVHKELTTTLGFQLDGVKNKGQVSSLFFFFLSLILYDNFDPLAESGLEERSLCTVKKNIMIH